MPAPIVTPNSDFLRQFRDRTRQHAECSDLDLRGSRRLGKTAISLPAPPLPLQILLGGPPGYRLHLYPELVQDATGQFGHRGDYLLVDPQTFFSEISGFIRIHPGDALTLGREDPLQQHLLHYPRGVDARHLRLKLTPNGLTLKNKSRAPTCVAPLTARDLSERMARWRWRGLERLGQLLGGPIEPLARADAAELIRQVNDLMAREPYRTLNDRGHPGGLLMLPHRPTPIVVGELRAQVDNLLVILTQNGFLDALAEGSAMLIILGSAVHSDRVAQAAEMDSSILMMDLIFRLKLRFPERVFYLRGRHDSFSEALNCGGLPQGSLWEDALHQARGPGYRDAMRTFYQRLPVIAATRHYLAAHGSPPIDARGLPSLVDLDPERAELMPSHPDFADHAPNRPSRRDLTRLFRRLGLADDATALMAGAATTWAAPPTDLLVAPRQPYRLYSGDARWVGLVTRVRKRLVSLVYPAEPVRRILKRRESATTGFEMR
ncbi:metallophosphoesterase [Thiocapsa imhoffii]|uniref:Metallophosphoesterase n=1 Tax=Thiocapsa imhoffii TaxID=382777 RepID=A0A9X1B7R7_9GAMM|nr:metallophosphoesterase [Thiocapsa imhoffii]MBK1643533.1 metallophosphoesterase [Thiocapsa imhoffii]